MFRLANNYKNGIELDINIEKAKELYEKASFLGHSGGKINQRNIY